MWHLQIIQDNSSQLFHTLAEIATYILGAAKIQEYKLSFIPIWEPLQPKRPTNDEPITKFPVPLSRG